MGLKQLCFEAINVGDIISGKSFKVTQEHIHRYAEVSGDFNPLHIDEDFAKNTSFKGTIAHGLMTLAFVSQVMTQWDWKRWLYGGEMDVKFIAPVRPGDDVTVNGHVIAKNKDSRSVCVELDVTNQHGESIIVGTAELQFD